jgi:hypothetical protein
MAKKIGLKKNWAEKKLGRKKKLAEKIWTKKHWPIYWPPHPQGHATIHASSSFVKKLHKNCLDERMMNIYVDWIYHFQPSSDRVTDKAVASKPEGSRFDPWLRQLNFFVISKEMHKSEYLIKFALPFSSKLISLWLVMTCKLQVLTSPKEMT